MPSATFFLWLCTLLVGDLQHANTDGFAFVSPTAPRSRFRPISGTDQFAPSFSTLTTGTGSQLSAEAQNLAQLLEPIQEFPVFDHTDPSEDFEFIPNANIAQAADYPDDEMLEYVPKTCTLVDFTGEDDLLQKRADFVRDAMQPSSPYYKYLKNILEPFILRRPFEKLFEVNVPKIGSYHLDVKLTKSEMLKYVPSNIDVQPMPGSKQGLNIKVDLERFLVNFYYNVEFYKVDRKGNKLKPIRSKLHLAVVMKNPSFDGKLTLACLDCEDNTRRFSKLRRYVGIAYRAATGFAFGGVSGAKVAVLKWIYDAKVEGMKFKFDQVDITARWTERPKDDELPDDLIRHFPSVVNILSQVARMAYNGPKKKEFEEGIATTVIDEGQKSLWLLRPDFYRTALFLKHRMGLDPAARYNPYTRPLE